MENLKLQLAAYAVLAGFLWAILPISAQASTTALATTGDPQSMVCNALANIMPCGTPTPAAKSTAPKNEPVSIGGILGSFFGTGSGSSSNSSNRNFTSNISEGFLGKTQKNLAVVLVKAPNHPEIYRIIGGKKFLIPNQTVFDSYGYLSSDIKTMSWVKIQSYPRVKLIKLDGDSTVYYLTEGGMTRRILTQAVFNSYADSDQDVIVINKIEFSLYPQNIYIFNESSSIFGRKPNVYLIGNSTKKLIFADELSRSGITNDMIAPVNQTEFDAYGNVLIVSSTQRAWYQFF